MRISAMCIRCLIDRQEERIREFGDENKKSAYLKEAAGIISSAQEDASAPYLVFRLNQAYKRCFGKLNNYEAEKQEFNNLMLDLEPELEKAIRQGSNKKEILKNAIKYARAGNYIDYGAANHVEKKQLLQLLREAEGEALDEELFERFCSDMETAQKLVYLADNCGEIVADKLLMKILKEQYPKVDITVIVRGMPVLNDVVLADAQAVGLTDLFHVIDNGNGVAGTQVNLLSYEARHALGTADVIISKGQGNFETIYGCRLNIYYLFLCKCEWFAKRFGMKRLKGVFINELDISKQLNE